MVRSRAALVAVAWFAVFVDGAGKRDVSEKKKKKYAEDTGFDWSETSDGCARLLSPREGRTNSTRDPPQVL